MKNYKIMEKLRTDENWKIEHFLTGGQSFHYKKAHIIKKHLKSMCSTINYKVKKGELK